MTSLKGLAVFASLLFAFYLLLSSAPAAAQTTIYACVTNSTGTVADCGRDYHLRDRHAQNSVE
jgi:hypothetical protein